MRISDWSSDVCSSDLVWPVLVQGEGAAQQVAAAIRGFNALPEQGRLPRPDLLIVARGGGSLEDLWAFNEEIVVRAAAERTEERRVGNACVSTCSSRWSP